MNSYLPNALHTAASAGNLELVRRLIAAGEDVNHLDADGFSALYFAAAEGQQQIVQVWEEAELERMQRGESRMWAVVAAMKTFDNDDERTTPEIIAWLPETSEEAPWELLGCDRASLNLYFPNPLNNPRRLAERMKALCSDVGHSGPEKLAEQLATTRHARFWWG